MFQSKISYSLDFVSVSELDVVYDYGTSYWREQEDESDFWVCWSLIDDVLDRINDIISSMDVSDEPKPCPFVREGTQSLDYPLKVCVFSGNAPDDDIDMWNQSKVSYIWYFVLYFSFFIRF